MFLYDLFLKHEGYRFINYTGNTTPYVVANNTIKVAENLTNIAQKLFNWFSSNQMKRNPAKCH